jgi:hypothetical protein
VGVLVAGRITELCRLFLLYVGSTGDGMLVEAASGGPGAARPELLVFAGRNDDSSEPMIQVLPSSERMRDYPIRLEDLIGALPIIEDRPAVAVLTDMLACSRTNGAVQPQRADGVNLEAK